MSFSIEYATFANYSPRGTSEASKKSRNACYAFKRGDANIVASLIKNFKADFENYPFDDFFGDDVTLVPAPRSAPVVTGGFWPAKIIADALRTAGFAKEVDALVERMYAVPKSATASPGDRPDAQTHYDSFRVNKALIVPQKITIVDDVLTKGCTTIAAAKRLHEAYPDTPIRIFAVMRTQSLVADVEKVRDPDTGIVKLRNGSSIRDP